MCNCNKIKQKTTVVPKSSNKSTRPLSEGGRIRRANKRLSR